MKALHWWMATLFIIWMILTMNFEFANIVVGLIISFSISYVYTKNRKDKVIKIDPYWFCRYILVFVKNLILSNIKIAKRILSKDMRLAPKIVEVETKLTEDWKKLLLANSITLTPGTLTLDVKGNILQIHVIEFHENMDKYEIIKEFEEVIEKI